MGLKVGEGNRTHPVMSKQKGNGVGPGVRARGWGIRLDGNQQKSILFENIIREPNTSYANYK